MSLVRTEVSVALIDLFTDTVAILNLFQIYNYGMLRGQISMYLSIPQ